MAISTEEMSLLEMFYPEEELVLTPTRSYKPLSQTAENVLVITAEEISLMPVHTLGDILNYLPGLQMDIHGGPGLAHDIHIQGSESAHVLVMLDGLPLNSLSEGHAYPGAIPVHIIERLEIIKGPASSTWGSSLGGVINIITKAAEGQEPIEGQASVQHGEYKTSDYCSEVAGTSGNFGYYLAASWLESDGMRPYTFFSENTFLTKLRLGRLERLQAHLSLSYFDGSHGMGAFSEWNEKEKGAFEYLFSSLTLNWQPDCQTNLSLVLRSRQQDSEKNTLQLDTETLIESSQEKEISQGAAAQLTWRQGFHHLVLGADFDQGSLKTKNLAGGKKNITEWALFSNDTIHIQKITINPGFRYDYHNLVGEIFSPSLGVTYQLVEHTLLRAYAAKGFHTPNLYQVYGKDFHFYQANDDLKEEKIKSIQMGLESAPYQFLWLRLSYFRHYLKDALVGKKISEDDEPLLYQTVNEKRQRRQGFELETKISPLAWLSLSGDYAYIKAQNLSTDKKILSIPNQIANIELQLKMDDSLFSGLLGHYVKWPSEAYLHSQDDTFVWDVFLKKAFLTDGQKRVEVSLMLHNLFNTPQYLYRDFQNSPLWLEGGLRFSF